MMRKCEPILFNGDDIDAWRAIRDILDMIYEGTSTDETCVYETTHDGVYKEIFILSDRGCVKITMERGYHRTECYNDDNLWVLSYEVNERICDLMDDCLFDQEEEDE